MAPGLGHNDGISRHRPIVRICLFYLSRDNLSSQRTSSKCNCSAKILSAHVAASRLLLAVAPTSPCRYTPSMSDLFIFAWRPLIDRSCLLRGRNVSEAPPGEVRNQCARHLFRKGCWRCSRLHKSVNTALLFGSFCFSSWISSFVGCSDFAWLAVVSIQLGVSVALWSYTGTQGSKGVLTRCSVLLGSS